MSEISWSGVSGPLHAPAGIARSTREAYKRACMSDTAAPAAPAAPQYSEVQLWLTLMTVTLATTLYAMTVTIANVALPKMQGTFGATQDEIAWVVTFNIIATAVATPATGWLAEKVGRRNVMVWGIVVFTLVSAGCGLAQSLEQLVFFRILQGLAGAPLVPVSQAIVMTIFPRERHGTALAVWGIGVTIGPILAPTLGGYVTELYGWRWIFFLLVPVGLVAFLCAAAFVRRRAERHATTLDWTGFIALALAIASLQLMLDRGERLGWFNHNEVILEAFIAGLAFYVFLAHIFTAERPFLQPRILTNRNFVFGLGLTFVFGLLNFTPMVLFPSLLQGLRGYPDGIIGFLLAVRGLGTLCGFVFIMLYGQRIDPRLLLLAGFVLQGISGLCIAQFDINLTTFGVAWTSMLQGFGIGLIWVPLSIVTFWTLAPRDVTEGTAIFHLMRNVGSSVHISLSVALVIHTSRMSYSELSGFVTPFNAALGRAASEGPWSLDGGPGMAALIGEINRQAQMIGYVNAFYLFGATAFVGIPLLFFVRRPTTNAVT